MLSEQTRILIRQFVLDFLATLKLKVGPDHSYVDSVQFALLGKADREHKHNIYDINGYHFPHLEVKTVVEDGDLTVLITISKIRGYDMSGTVIGIDWPTKGEAPIPLPPVQQFVRGELTYRFQFGQVRPELYPLLVQAFMKDQNDLEVDVRSSVHMATLIPTRE